MNIKAAAKSKAVVPYVDFYYMDEYAIQMV
jgi:hypothetical protein